MNIKKNSLLWDTIAVFVIFLPITFVLLFNFPKFVMNLDNFTEILVGLFGTLLGFILTAVTILFMFDIDKSEILKKIKDAGLYSQIFERFISTIVITFISLIAVLFYYFLSKLTGNIRIVDILIFYLCTLVLVRVYRVLRILYLIYGIIKPNPTPPTQHG